MERFSGVQGRQNVSAITAALEESGCRILKAADPHSAPFEFTIETPDERKLDLVCYAFTANKYRQDGRPSDEHRMQVKYGSDFTRAYDLFFDPSRRKLTLMFGWHAEEQLFIAVDPTLHSPTWFSTSIEFKAGDLEQAQRLGWFGWERERQKGGRRRVLPNESFTTEALVAFKPKHFFRYITLEQAASGMETGPRLLAIDRMRRERTDRHPLELALGLSASEILDVLNGSFRLLVAVRGSVAERHLLTQLQALPELSDVTQIDADGQPDFEVRYRARKFRIEVKNVLRRLPKTGGPKLDFQKTRASKNNPCSRYYRRDQFEVLAACMQPVNEHWDYLFASTSGLPAHKTCEGRISHRLRVAGSQWMPRLVDVLDETIG